MAALGRKVLAPHQLIPLTWARGAGHAPGPRGQKGQTASLLRKLTTASRGRGPEEVPRAEPKKRVQEPERRTTLTRHLHGKPLAPVGGRSSEREDVLRSLQDMGFSHVHSEDLLALQPGSHPQQVLGVVSELILLGVNPEPAYATLKKSPHLLKLPVTQMKQRSGYLRRLGLGEGKLRRVLHCCPEVLSLPQRDIDSIVRVLRDKCLFTVQQVTEVLHRCPYVLRADPGELEYKFQYAYFRMGVSQADVVRTDFLQYSIAKIRQRHTFLERLGRYQTPDKKGQTQVPNPSLKDVLRVSEAEFLARTACASAEEFEVFKQLLAREEQEQPRKHWPGDEDEVGDEDQDEGSTSDEDPEGQGRR